MSRLGALLRPRGTGARTQRWAALGDSPRCVRRAMFDAATGGDDMLGDRSEEMDEILISTGEIAGEIAGEAGDRKLRHGASPRDTSPSPGSLRAAVQRARCGETAARTASPGFLRARTVEHCTVEHCTVEHTVEQGFAERTPVPDRDDWSGFRLRLVLLLMCALRVRARVRARVSACCRAGGRMPDRTCARSGLLPLLPPRPLGPLETQNK